MPQSSVLGPLCFLFCVNDLPNVSEILSCVLFADETTLFLTGNISGNLVTVSNAEIGGVSNWTEANMLSLNMNC